MIKIYRFFVLLLTFVLLFSLSVPVFADVTIGSGNDTTAGGGASGTGEIGGFVEADTPTVDDKAIKIKKEITAFNPDEVYVYGPAITYEYALAAASAGELVTVTDLESTANNNDPDHYDGLSRTTTVLPGILTGVSVTGDGSAIGTPEIVWDNTDILEASANGTANYKYLKLDFSNVVFSQPGVYRYKITESLKTGSAYNTSGVTDGSITAIRYLDVYVMRSPDATNGRAIYTDGSTAAQWKVYGYVCIDSTLGTTNIVAGPTATVKTDGFVDTDGTTATVTADQYKTYNLTVTKDLIGDDTMINHKFPFEVSFDTTTNSKTGTFQLIVEMDTNSKSEMNTATTTSTNIVAAGTAIVNDPTPVTGTTVDIVKAGNAQVLSAMSYKANIADGNQTTGTTTGFVKLIGIPYGVIATVTEKNDNLGTTYTTSVKEDVATVDGISLSEVDVSSVSGTGAEIIDRTPDIAKLPYNTTASRITNGATAYNSDKNVKVQFTNNLAIISPTGVAFRVAPYALMMCFGIIILAISRRTKEEYA